MKLIIITLVMLFLFILIFYVVFYEPKERQKLDDMTEEHHEDIKDIKRTLNKTDQNEEN